MSKEKELLFSVNKDDFEVQTFCSGGKGGQNQNKRFTGVRIVHVASGAVGECREERDQRENKKRALQRLSESPKFKIWVNKMFYEIENGKTVEQKVEQMLENKYIKTEAMDEIGNWHKINNLNDLNS